jgi:hypothetical protein
VTESVMKNSGIVVVKPSVPTSGPSTATIGTASVRRAPYA